MEEFAAFDSSGRLRYLFVTILYIDEPPSSGTAEAVHEQSGKPDGTLASPSARRRPPDGGDSERHWRPSSRPREKRIFMPIIG